jgi:SAM-dependent methyltransferase
VNYQRLYEYRFRDVDQQDRIAVWKVISRFIHREMGSPQCILDPAAGRGEFILSIDAAERWAVDMVRQQDYASQRDVRFVEADIFAADLPEAHFDGVFVSNFLEHLPTQEKVAEFLTLMHRRLRPGGRIAVLGPNFKYCMKEYFDCADHVLALTHLAVAEHLFAAGFALQRVHARFLPFSFRSLLPASPRLTSTYLGCRPLWTLLGKQFLLIASKT